jgi:glycosyltransferase involved in cell wall biosynthesis
MPESSVERPFVTFVVPCFNESRNIAATIEQIEGAARDARVPSLQILVVDDCSTDNSAAIVAGLAAASHEIRLISNPVNLGFGGAYKEGLSRATGDHVIMVPGDNQHPRESIRRILSQAGKADIVVPFVLNTQVRPWQRRLVSRAFTLMINRMFGFRLPYYNGCVLYKTDLLRSIEIETDSFAYQAECLVKLLRSGATYVTVGVEIVESSRKGSSAFRPRNVAGVLKTAVVLWFSLRREAAARGKGRIQSSVAGL